MGKFFSCYAYSNSEDKKDADFTAYGKNSTSTQKADTSCSTVRHGGGHSDSMGGGDPGYRTSDYVARSSGMNSGKLTNGSSANGRENNSYSAPSTSLEGGSAHYLYAYRLGQRCYGGL